MVSVRLGVRPWRGRLAIVLLLLALFGLTVFWAPRASSGPPIDKLYWTDYGDQKILRANLDGTGVEEVVTNIDARDLAIDSTGGKMYWTNISLRKIQRANLDGTQVEDLVTLIGLAQPRGIALDLVAGKVYWTDDSDGSIHRASLDGTNAETFMLAADAVSVAVDGVNGKVYWSRASFSGGIGQANLDGTGVETFTHIFLGSPDLALDLVRGHIYYVDSILIGLEPFVQFDIHLARRNLDGSGYLEIDQSDCVLGIAVEQPSGAVFWTINAESGLCLGALSRVVGPGFTLGANRPWGIAVARDPSFVITPTPTPSPTNTPGPVGGISAGGELRPLGTQTAGETLASYVAVAVLLSLGVAGMAGFGVVRYVRRR